MTRCTLHQQGPPRPWRLHRSRPLGGRDPRDQGPPIGSFRASVACRRSAIALGDGLELWRLFHDTIGPWLLRNPPTVRLVRQVAPPSTWITSGVRAPVCLLARAFPSSKAVPAPPTCRSGHRCTHTQIPGLAGLSLQPFRLRHRNWRGLSAAGTVVVAWRRGMAQMEFPPRRCNLMLRGGSCSGPTSFRSCRRR